MKKTKLITRGAVIKQRDLLYGNYIGNQIFTETSTLRQLKGFDLDFKMWQDLDMWYRLTSLGNVEIIPHATYFFDTTHLLGRISNNKEDVLLNTKDLFSYKHNLSSFDTRMLNNHLYLYGVMKHKDRLAKIFKEINKFFRYFR
jgi:hypothetical protein